MVPFFTTLISYLTKKSSLKKQSGNRNWLKGAFGLPAFAKLHFAFRMNLTGRQKARIYNQCVLPVLT